MIITRRIFKKSKLNVHILAVLSTPKRLFPVRRITNEKVGIRHQWLRLCSYIIVVGRKVQNRKNCVVNCFFKRERVVVGCNYGSILFTESWKRSNKK